MWAVWRAQYALPSEMQPRIPAPFFRGGDLATFTRQFWLSALPTAALQSKTQARRTLRVDAWRASHALPSETQPRIPAPFFRSGDLATFTRQLWLSALPTAEYGATLLACGKDASGRAPDFGIGMRASGKREVGCTGPSGARERGAVVCAYSSVLLALAAGLRRALPAPAQGTRPLRIPLAAASGPVFRPPQPTQPGGFCS